MRRIDNVALRRRDQINEVAIRIGYDVNDDMKNKEQAALSVIRDKSVWFQCVDA
jgi:hypothetical protein